MALTKAQIRDAIQNQLGLPKNKRERRGRNPATGQDMMLEKRRVLTFKCSGKLRDSINNKGK